MTQRKAESNRLQINYQQQQSLVHFFSYTCKLHFQKSIKLTFSGSFAILVLTIIEMNNNQIFEGYQNSPKEFQFSSFGSLACCL